MRIILCYHRISNIYDDFNLMNVSIHNFESHMKYIKNYFSVMSLEQLVESDAQDTGENCIAITFDDGYRDVYRNVLPILEKYQLPATVFITTENIDSVEENWPDQIMRTCLQPAIYHDYFDIDNELIKLRCNTRNLRERCDFYTVMGAICGRLGSDARKKQLQELDMWAGQEEKGRESRRILTTEEIRILANNPLITIGSHTITHPVLKCLTEKEQLSEIRDSKEMLESITGKTHDFFAYPYGGKAAYDETTVKLLKECGYRLAVAMGGRSIESCIDMFRVPRCAVYNYDGREFKDWLGNIFRREDIKSQIIESSQNDLPLAYVGALKEDTEIISGKQKIVIWGYGYWGKELYAELKALGLDGNILAFGDKNAERLGVTNSGIPVMTAEQIIAKENLSEISILIKGVYDWDIYMELRKKGFKNLHILLR